MGHLRVERVQLLCCEMSARALKLGLTLATAAVEALRVRTYLLGFHDASALALKVKVR